MTTSLDTSTPEFRSARLAYYRVNRERICEAKRKCRETKPEQYRKKEREYCAKNSERILANARARWVHITQENRDKRNAAKRLKRARDRQTKLEEK